MRGTPGRRVAIAALLAVALLLLGSLLVPTRSSGSSGLTVVVVNNNPDVATSEVFVMAQAGGTDLVAAPQTLAQRDSFTLPSIRSGRVFVSLGRPLAAQGEPSPDTSMIRYDTVELTYPGVANLTAVDMFGIPLDLEVFDSHGELVGAKRWDCYTDVVQESLATSLTTAGGDFSKIRRTDSDGNFLRVVSPNIVSGLHPSGYPTFEDYLASLAGVTLIVRGSALGQDYWYTGAFLPDDNDPDGPGVLTLIDEGPDHLSPLEVTGRSLIGNSGNATNGIYGNNSPYLVGGQPHSGNDVYAAAYRDLVAGFAYGFWGNPDYGNDSARFDVASPPGPFSGAQPNAPYYNVWAAALWPLTDAYGFPYGDTFNDAPDRNPIVELPTDGTLRITVQPDISPDSCRAAVPQPTPPENPPASETPSPANPTVPPVSPGPIDPAYPPPTRPQGDRPGRPGRPSVKRAGPQAVRVTWTPPRGADRARWDYVVQTKSGARCSVTGSMKSTTARVELLRSWRGGVVRFRVTAANSAGTGPPSRTSRHRFGRDVRATSQGTPVNCQALGW